MTRQPTFVLRANRVSLTLWLVGALLFVCLAFAFVWLGLIDDVWLVKIFMVGFGVTILFMAGYMLVLVSYLLVRPVLIEVYEHEFRILDTHLTLKRRSFKRKYYQEDEAILLQIVASVSAKIVIVDHKSSDEYIVPLFGVNRPPLDVFSEVTQAIKFYPDK